MDLERPEKEGQNTSSLLFAK